jgi:excinuclease UvrABC nuclease subunit
MERLAVPGLETPDLILLDGGPAQLNAVMRNWSMTSHPNVRFAAATKPRGKHLSISHFLTERGEKITFDASDPSHHLLKLLRDEAHNLANRAHRDLRDMTHNYELASILPSISEAERREVLRSVGSITKIAGLSDEDLVRNFRSQTARKIKRDLSDYRSGNSSPVVPLIVPIRFDDEKGGADDLRPIATS